MAIVILRFFHDGWRLIVFEIEKKIYLKFWNSHKKIRM